MIVIDCLLLLLPMALAMETEKPCLLNKAKRGVEKQCFGELGFFDPADFKNERNFELLPKSREEIDTNFNLYIQVNKARDGPYKIKASDAQCDPKFKKGKPVKILVHGFRGKGTDEWLMEVSKSFLANHDVNVIAVDWHKGCESSLIPTDYEYNQASTNTWVVGGEIYLLSKFLVEKCEVSYDMIHIMGHSLGSHVAGYAGRRMKGQLGRITGLDAADPNFQNTPAHMRLDPTDAIFVDAIHTDASDYAKLWGFGLKQPVGNFDFYPNGGEDQPGCRKKRDVQTEEEEQERIGCHHSRAPELFEASLVTTCPFLGHECDSYETFIQGKCNSCGENGEKCAHLGNRANEHPNPTGATLRKMYLITSDKKPFCLYHYSIELVLKTEFTNGGSIGFVLHGTNSITHSFTMNLGSFKQVIGVPHNLGSVDKLTMTFADGNWFTTREINVEKIIVEPLDIQKESERQAAVTTLWMDPTTCAPLLVIDGTENTFRQSNTCH